MKSKLEFKRSDLIIRRTDGKYTCVLCGRVWRDHDISHKPTCVFAQNCITGIKVDGISGGIVFRQEQQMWWWVSPASGAEYSIEKIPGWYVMLNVEVREIRREPHLYDLRLWIGLNQGVL